MSQDNAKTVKQSAVLVDLEYYIKEYYNAHFRQRVSAVVKDIEKHQQSEAATIRHDHAKLGGMTGSGGLPVGNMMTEEAVARGAWNSQTLVDFMDASRDRMFNGKDSEQVVHDFAEITKSYREALKKNMGAERYKELSLSCPSRDLATDYVMYRFQQLACSQVLKSHEVPRSTIEYLYRYGSARSFMLMGKTIAEGAIASGQSRDELCVKYFGKDAGAAIKDFYRPSSAEKVGEGLVGMGLDLPLTFSGGAVGVALDGAYQMGDSHTDGAVGEGVEAFVKQALRKSPGGWLAGKLGADFSSSEPAKSFEQQVSEDVFGDARVMPTLHQKGLKKRSDEGVCEEVSSLNRRVEKPVSKVRSAIGLDPGKQKGKIEDLFMEAGNDGHAVKRVSDLLVQELGVQVTDSHPVAGWMQRGDMQFRAHNAAFYLGLADEMRQKGSKVVRVGKNELTFQQVVQRGYDYARSAELLQNSVDAQMAAELEAARQAEEAANLAAMEQARREAQSSRDVPARVKASKQNTEGWDKLASTLGLDGLSGLGKNLGYLIASLPNLMVGMFTGKLPGFGVKDNLLGIASIVMGLFVRNPFLKLLLIGFGGANILNRANKQLTGAAGVSVSRNGVKNYSDEPLNPRLSNMGMKGNTLVVDIDGRPCVVEVNEEVGAAYRAGHLPLNTLANAVLKKYDAEQQLTVGVYEREVSLSRDEERERSRGLR